MSEENEEVSGGADRGDSSATMAQNARLSQLDGYVGRKLRWLEDLIKKMEDSRGEGEKEPLQADRLREELISRLTPPLPLSEMSWGALKLHLNLRFFDFQMWMRKELGQPCDDVVEVHDRSGAPTGLIVVDRLEKTAGLALTFRGDDRKYQLMDHGLDPDGNPLYKLDQIIEDTEGEQ